MTERLQLRLYLVVCLSGIGATAGAQIPEETVTRKLAVQSTRIRIKKVKSIKLGTFEARYRYRIACIRRLLPLQNHINRCVDAQRMITGEFHDRLDFRIEPSGKVKEFGVYRMKNQLKACLMPHMLPLRFPRFSGKPSFLLQVGVGSPGCRLGRRIKAKPVAVYPVETDENKKVYRRALFWVVSPWNHAISACAERTDRQLGYGYRFKMALEVSPKGVVTRGALQVRGKLASAAADPYAKCVLPFLKGMRLPPHQGPGPFVFKIGSSTARWGMD